MNLSRFSPLRAGLLIGTLAAAVYLNTLPNDFVIDDRGQIIDNTFFRRSDALRQIFTTDVWAFFGREAGSSYYRPLMYTFWLPLWRAFQHNPAAYHAVNILLHAAVSVLVFLWLRRMRAGETAALLAALLFAVHPIHTEAVAWISALPDLQCALFFLLGFWLYLAAEEKSQVPSLKSPVGQIAMQAGVAACVLLALLSKEIGFALPLMLAAYVGHGFSRAAPWRARMSVAALGVIAAIAIYLAMRHRALGSLMPPSSGFALPARKLVAGWFALLYEYTARIVLPLKLSAFHVVAVPGSFFEPKVLAGLVIAGGLCALAVWLYRRGRHEWLAVLLFLAPLAASFLAPLRENGFWMGERYLYLPSIGFCWLLAAAIADCGLRIADFRPSEATQHSALSTQHFLTAAFVLLLMASYATRTIFRNAEWRQEIPFYLHELRAEGESPQLRPLLTEAMVRRGMPDRALEHAQAMARLAPRDARAHNSLGFVYWVLGDRETTLSEYQLAAECARQSGQTGFAARALNNMAVVYSQLGQMELAIPAYQEAIRLDPGFADGRSNLGSALFAIGRNEEAEAELRSAIRLNPAMSSAHSNLGLVLAARRNLPAARAALAEALRLAPDNAETIARAGEVETLAGNSTSARHLFDRALTLDPANARAQAGLSRLRISDFGLRNSGGPGEVRR